VNTTTLAAAIGLAATCGYLTARRHLTGQLTAARHAATHDLLTGIANRAGLAQRADSIVATGNDLDCPVIAALVDLVGFKQVNDTHGHDAGDHILTVIADRLTALTASAGIAARLGGDEFALITSPPATADLTAWLGDVHAFLTVPVDYQGRPLTVGATVGAYIGLPDQPYALWLHHADLAMYQARAHRRSTCLHRDPHGVDIDRRPVDRIREQARPTSRLATSTIRRTAA
jgi:diguanylate cyclase (GGDEF)-like protein